MGKVYAVIKLWSLSIFFIPYLVGCQQSTETLPVDKSFLNEQPCAAPCWYGLELGASTMDQTTDILDQVEFIEPNSIMVLAGNNENHWIQFQCLYSAGKEELQDEPCGLLLFDDSRVLVSMTLRQNYELYLKQVLEKLNTPDGFTIVNSYDGCIMKIFWLSKHIGSSILIGSKQELSCLDLNEGRISDDILDWTVDWLNYSIVQPRQKELYSWSLEP